MSNTRQLLDESPVVPGIYFVALHLFVDKDLPLDQLHEAARRAGVTARTFAADNPPRYAVTQRTFPHVLTGLGFRSCQVCHDAMREILERCWRSERGEMPALLPYYREDDER